MKNEKQLINLKGYNLSGDYAYIIYVVIEAKYFQKKLLGVQENIITVWF